MRVDSEAAIGGFKKIGNDLQFNYEFPDPVVVLQAADGIGKVFQDIPGAKINFNERSITLERTARTLFYWVRSNLCIELLGPEIRGTNLVFSMAFSHPRTVRAGEPYDAFVTLLNTSLTHQSEA